MYVMLVVYYSAPYIADALGKTRENLGVSHLQQYPGSDPPCRDMGYTISSTNPKLSLNTGIHPLSCISAHTLSNF